MKEYILWEGLYLLGPEKDYSLLRTIMLPRADLNFPREGLCFNGKDSFSLESIMVPSEGFSSTCEDSASTERILFPREGFYFPGKDYPFMRKIRFPWNSLCFSFIGLCITDKIPFP